MILVFGVPGLFLLLLIVFVGALIGGMTTRVCPYCAERINKKASACRYCGRDVGRLRPMPALPEIDPNAPRPSRRPEAILAFVLLGVLALLLYSQTGATTPTGMPSAKESRMQAAAPPMLPPAAPFVDAPIATASSPKALPKDAKPKAPAPPLRITPQ